MISRRMLLKTTAAAALLPAPVRAAATWREAMATSPLIYVTPIQTSGAESRCQSEVWFASLHGAFHVVTAADTWRSESVRRGLTQARIWVGDVGPVGSSDGKYRALPMVNATASIEADPTAWEPVLEVMSRKYADGWDKWGPRFRNGLADGSRVMLKYVPAA